MQSADLRIKRAQADINEALGVKPQPPAQNPDIGYGRREDGSNKGRGFYGMLPRTDGPDQSSELSIGVEMDGKQRTIPSMVPGLNAEQLRYLLSVQKPMRPDITQKAVDFAVQRQQQGKGPFAEPNEEGAYRVPRYAQGGSVKARRRTPSDYITDAIASGLGILPAYKGDERAAYQRAKDFTGLLDWTPAGIPEALYEAGGMLGAGARDRSALGTAGGLGMAAIAGLPLPGKKVVQKSLKAFHGSPVKGLRELLPSERGPLGPAVYLTPNDAVAQRYGENLYTKDLNQADIFHGMGRTGLSSADNPYQIWRDQAARLSGVAADKAGDVAAMMEKLGPSDGYRLFRDLAGTVGGDEGAQRLLSSAGYKGISGHIDGPEIAMFDKLPLDTGIRAYHGSPHAFDKFDLSKIGTGEGAQSYGHGLYFAENEGVARSYRDQLSGGTDRLVGGLPYNSKDPEHLAASLAKTYEKHGGRDRILQVLRDDLATMNLDDASRDTYQKTIDIIKNNSPLQPFVTSPRGHMYEVNINADPAQFLDWDNPLSVQSPHIQEVAKRLGAPFDLAASRAWDDELYAAVKDPGEMNLSKRPYNPDGANFYESTFVTPGAFRNRAHASQTLLDNGIPGIKYLDQGSRNKGEGTRNFVVFKPDLVDILKRYAVPVAGAGTAASLAVKQPQEEDY